MTSALPFDDFRNLAARLPALDADSAQRVRSRFEALGMPAEGLGRLAGIAEWLAASSGKPPVVNRPLVALFAGNHGVAAHGLANQPMAATAAFVEHCAAGGSAVSQLCGANDLGLKVFDLALVVPTEDFTRDAAFDERGCAATMAFGMEAIAGGFDLIALGGFGVAGDFVAGTVLSALWSGEPEEWLPEVKGVDQRLQVSAAQRALSLHGGAHFRDPFEVLRRVGGREIAAIAGAIIAARMERVPVLLDGMAALAAAAILHEANHQALEHCRFASSQPGSVYAKALARLDTQPLLDLGTSQPGVGLAMAAEAAKASAQLFSGIRPLPATTH